MNRLLIFVVLFGVLSCKKEQAAQQQTPEVPVAQVLQQPVDITQDFVGQTYGGSDIEIRARVQGWLLQKHFVEGSEVKKGQLLYTIDPLPYQTKVDQAKGQLAEADAMLVKAKSDLDRIKPLAEMNAVSQRELVAAQGQYDAAVARKRSMASNLENAQIELSYCRIASPIDGTIGISKADIGDFVGGLNLLVLNTVSSITAMRVRFSISEREYLSFRKRILAGGKINPSAELILSDGSLHEQKGQLNLANREIDPATGTLTLEAVFPNPNKILRPGQFARVRMITESLPAALLVPQRAVTEIQGTYQVYVVDKENKLQIKVVETGDRLGDNWIITKGVEPTDRVALVGNAALRVNTVITPVPVKSGTTNP
ncbi:MAG: efflux RND transporter periplasmic adaptor subunit [Cyclobacteriaceae bacterium]|nr:efflux RND transporter periplasmic adaptor subunit [Cyclobacteriaceae bacterium]